ncbi:MAG: FKBP-type peptidyl-prolyl cis-trans isomerase [Thermoplasmata archaeon]
MAKRRKLGHEEGTAECHYCGKDVPERAWKCPYCRRWYSEGKEMMVAISIIAILILALVGYTVAQYVDLSGEGGEGGGGPSPSYSIEIRTHGQFEAHNTEPGRSTSFMIFAGNKAQVADTIDFSFEGVASGINPHLKYQSRIMTPGSILLNILTVDVDASVLPGTYSITVRATSRGDSEVTDTVEVSVQIYELQTDEVAEGNYIRCDYILWLSDGSVKDSGESLKVYTGRDEIDPQWQADGYMTVIEGFRKTLVGMKISETNVVAVPPQEGYTNPDDELYNQWLYFQITLISIDG